MKEVLDLLLAKRDLTQVQAREAMAQVIAGRATPAQIAGFLVALSAKGETTDEITGFARAMREAAVPLRANVPGPVIDTSGTGGARVKTFNFSTLAAFVAAGAGAFVAKHGNRSGTGICGSADVLEALGARLDFPPERAASVLERTGVVFCFAPAFHPATRHAAPVRRELGVRTVFNVLGPLTSPSQPQGQVVGVFSERLVVPLATVLSNLGVSRAIVAHGVGGLDEISTVGETVVATLEEGAVRSERWRVEDLGVPRASAADIGPLPPPEAAKEFRNLLSGARGPRRDAMLVNAAAALLVARRASTLREGLRRAQESVDSGAALAKLDAFLAAAREAKA
ncbi:MAG TPA: anthranilate phosphoribosyltransferase [Candidatus Thermoplasmatota archaeon]|nr:anthranilate phosphoribosyltransferase [Candidatus Thermoplasmatota archaeon]